MRVNNREIFTQEMGPGLHLSRYVSFFCERKGRKSALGWMSTVQKQHWAGVLPVSIHGWTEDTGYRGQGLTVEAWEIQVRNMKFF